MDSIALALLKRPSERDQQISIGPSDIGDPCTYCLAEKLYHKHHGLPKPEEDRTYWLGARIGTAIHADLEILASQHEGLVPEQKIEICELDGYGTIKGTADLYDSNTFVLHDFKTTVRDKLKKIKSAKIFYERPMAEIPVTMRETAHKLIGYKGQTHLYAYGLEQKGCKITRIVIDFIARDGKTDGDFWSMAIDYDPEYAKAVIKRLEAIWNAIRSGYTLDKFESNSNCYTCSRRDS